MQSYFNRFKQITQQLSDVQKKVKGEDLATINNAKKTIDTTSAYLILLITSATQCRFVPVTGRSSGSSTSSVVRACMQAGGHPDSVLPANRSWFSNQAMLILA